jgi:hypothetical protein
VQVQQTLYARRERVRVVVEVKRSREEDIHFSVWAKYFLGNKSENFPNSVLVKKMPVVTRSTDAVAGGAADGTPGASVAKKEAPDCAICLNPIDKASEVVLMCNHAFHGQCAARHLQLDRRCPVCRKAPRTQIEDDDEEEEEQRAIDFSEDAVIHRLLKKVRPANIKSMLRDFNVPEVDSETNKEALAELLSEQLHYETDDD